MRREWQSLLHKVLLKLILGGGGGVRVCVPFAWLYSPLPGSGIFSLTCLQQFLQQAEPADAVCCAVLPDLCIDIQTFHVALVDIFISQLGATLGVFYLNQVDWRMSLGIRPSSIRHMLPSRRSRRYLSSVYIMERPARARTWALSTLSPQLMPRMWRRRRMWKLSSFCSCLA